MNGEKSRETLASCIKDHMRWAKENNHAAATRMTEVQKFRDREKDHLDCAADYQRTIDILDAIEKIGGQPLAFPEAGDAEIDFRQRQAEQKGE